MDNQSYRLPNDTVTIENAVLLTVVRAAALSVPGVLRIGYGSGRLERVLGRGFSESGIYIEVEDEVLTIDVFIILDAGVQLRETSLQVQDAVTRTMQQYVGMTVKSVNVYVEDVIFEKA